MESFAQGAVLGCESEAPLQCFQKNHAWVLQPAGGFQFLKIQNGCSWTSHRALHAPPTSNSFHHFCPNDIRVLASRGYHEEDTRFPEFRVEPQAVQSQWVPLHTSRSGPGDQMAFAEHLLCFTCHTPLTFAVALLPSNKLSSELLSCINPHGKNETTKTCSGKETSSSTFSQ